MTLAKVYRKRESIFIENAFTAGLWYEIHQPKDDDEDPAAEPRGNRLGRSGLALLAEVAEASSMSCLVRVWPACEGDPANYEEWSLVVRKGAAEVSKGCSWKPNCTFLAGALSIGSRGKETAALAGAFGAAARPRASVPNYPFVFGSPYKSLPSRSLPRMALLSQEPWVKEVLGSIRSCLSEARSGLPIKDVFQRLDGLELADNSVSRPEFNKMVLTYAPGLSPQQLQQLFALVNASGSGGISFEEFDRHLGPSSEALGLDPDADAGALAWMSEPWAFEALGVVASCIRQALPGVPVDELFRGLDGFQAYDCSLSAAGFHKMVHAYRPGLTEQQMRRLFSLVNRSGTGALSLGEFRAIFKACSAVEEPWAREILNTVRACLGPARSGLSIEEVFRRLDCLDSQDDTLSRVEFDKLVLTYRPRSTAHQLHRLFALVNVSGSGGISLGEFKSRFGPHSSEERWARDILNNVAAQLSEAKTGLSTEEVFLKLDGLDKKDGSLSRPEFEKMVLTYSRDLDKEQLMRLFALVNASGSGAISLAEFRRRFGPAPISGPETEEPWAREVMDAVAYRLSPARSGFPIEEVFRRLDGLDKADGCLSRVEFEKVILTYKPGLSQQKVQKLFAIVNASRSGKISLSEFKAQFDLAHRAGRAPSSAPAFEPWMRAVLDEVGRKLSPAEAGMSSEEVFQRLDGLDSKDGALSRAEFDKVLLTYRPELDKQQLQKLFAHVNTSGSGKISPSELLRVIVLPEDADAVACALPRAGRGSASSTAPPSGSKAAEPWMQAVLDEVAHALSPAKANASIEEVFRRLDGLDSKDNALSRVEFDKVVLTYRPKLDKQQLQQLFARVNASGSGKISLGEFKAQFDLSQRPAPKGPAQADPWARAILDTVAKALSPAETKLSIEEVFQRLDGLDSKDNALSRVEFDKMVLTYKPGLSGQELQKLFATVNDSGSGKISLGEFKEHLGWPKAPAAAAAISQTRAGEQPGGGPPASSASSSARPAGPETAPAGGPPAAPKAVAGRPGEAAWVTETFDTVARALQPEKTGMAIEEVFRRLDGLDTKDNALSRTEFDKMILTYKPDMPPPRLQTLFEKVNVSRSGKISLDEFKQRFASP